MDVHGYTEAGSIRVTINGKTMFVDDTDNPNRRMIAAWEAAGNVIPAYEPPSDQDRLDDWRATIVVSRFQAKAALASAGLLSAVETAVANADDITKLAWSEALTFSRNSPTIINLGAALGMSDEQLDGLFETAMEIEV